MYAFKHVWMCASVCLNVSLRACVCACESMHWMAASGPLLFPLCGVQSRRDTRFYEQTAADPRPAIWAITHSALGPHGKLDKLMPSDIQHGGEGENDYFSDCWYINVCVRGQSIGGWVMGGRDLWEKRWLGVVTCMLMQQQCNYYWVDKGMFNVEWWRWGRGEGPAAWHYDYCCNKLHGRLYRHRQRGYVR